MSMEKIVSLCKRRGFVFQSSEIYGGFGAVYDYGPLGIALKNNISQLSPFVKCAIATLPFRDSRFKGKMIFSQFPPFVKCAIATFSLRGLRIKNKII